MDPRCVHITTVHARHDARILYKEVVTLRQAGYEVLLVAPGGSDEEIAGVPVLTFPRKTGVSGRFANLRRAYRIARALEPSICHVHDPEVLPMARVLKGTTGCRVIYDFHEMYRRRGSAKGRLAHRLEQWALGWLDYAILANPSSEVDVRDTGVEYSVVPNYVLRNQDQDPDARGSTATPLRILYAGVLGKARGMDTMLRLAETIRDESLPWTIDLVGRYSSGKHRREDEARITRGRLQGLVKREGWETFVPWTAIRRSMERSDVGLALLEPTDAYRNTIPTKFFDYTYHGLPIICSDFPLWRRWVEEHGCGVAVDPADSIALVAALRRMHNDAAYYAALSEAAVRAGRQYTWDRVEGRLVAAYDSLRRP